jgi:hypothetical protein
MPSALSYFGSLLIERQLLFLGKTAATFYDCNDLGLQPSPLPPRLVPRLHFKPFSFDGIRPIGTQTIIQAEDFVKSVQKILKKTESLFGGRLFGYIHREEVTSISMTSEHEEQEQGVLILFAGIHVRSICSSLHEL